jgi:hypothetical protein
MPEAKKSDFKAMLVMLMAQGLIRHMVKTVMEAGQRNLERRIAATLTSKHLNGLREEAMAVAGAGAAPASAAAMRTYANRPTSAGSRPAAPAPKR